jgi:hypothetical protein
LFFAEPLQSSSIKSTEIIFFERFFLILDEEQVSRGIVSKCICSKGSLGVAVGFGEYLKHLWQKVRLKHKVKFLGQFLGQEATIKPEFRFNVEKRVENLANKRVTE